MQVACAYVLLLIKGIVTRYLLRT